MCLIHFDGVSKTYRGQQAEVVKNISMTIAKGEIVVLIGPSGCGKTTCLKMINRLIDITSGKIYINGEDIEAQDPIELRRRMGYVIQQTGLFPHMTVKENIEIIPTLQKKDKDKIAARTRELMNMVGLDAEEYLSRYPTQLSGGQLQRIGVARAFATDPDIVLMDEPFSAVDPITRSQLQDELLFMQSSLNKTIVFVTHDMDEAIKLADKICILHEGVLEQYDTPEKIMKEPASDYVARFVGPHRIWKTPEYIRAEDIMLSSPTVVPPELSAFKAMEMMRDDRVDSAMVINDARQLLGVVFARDILASPDRQVPCSSLMRKPEITAYPERNIVWLLEQLSGTKVRTIPIISKENRLLGVVTMSSLATAMSQQFSNGNGGMEVLS